MKPGIGDARAVLVPVGLHRHRLQGISTFNMNPVSCQNSLTTGHTWSGTPFHDEPALIALPLDAHVVLGRQHARRGDRALPGTLAVVLGIGGRSLDLGNDETVIRPRPRQVGRYLQRRQLAADL
jgi:hypothetical protein